MFALSELFSVLQTRLVAPCRQRLPDFSWAKYHASFPIWWWVILYPGCRRRLRLDTATWGSSRRRCPSRNRWAPFWVAVQTRHVGKCYYCYLLMLLMGDINVIYPPDTAFISVQRECNPEGHDLGCGPILTSLGRVSIHVLGAESVAKKPTKSPISWRPTLRNAKCWTKSTLLISGEVKTPTPPLLLPLPPQWAHRRSGNVSSCFALLRRLRSTALH